jgi:hypothetical protein
MRDKGLHMARCADPRQGYFDGQADQHERRELLELAGAGADVLHGADVESEVADIRAVGADIGSSPITISLIRRAAFVLSAGTQGTLMHVMSC